jgi:hypothetical protein
MNLATSPALIVEPSAREFMKQHGAETAFDRHCELVYRCFPEARSVHVRLLEDPDEENHTWVVLQAFLPASHPHDVLQAQNKRYHDELVQTERLPYHPLSFSLALDFTQE